MFHIKAPKVTRGRLAGITGALLFAIVIFAGGILIGTSRQAVEPVTSDAATESPSRTLAGEPTTEPLLSERLVLMDERMTVLGERQNDLNSFISLAVLPLFIFTAILAAGGMVGIVLSFRSEIRSGQSHDLVIAGQSAQQARTEEVHAVLLDASQKTLTLVNDTLELARDASERAAKTLSERAERLLNEISDKARRLLIEAHYHRAFDTKMLKIAVEEPEIRNEMLDLSQRLASIEGYLEFQEIPLTAPSYIVKGMAHHLNQDEERAIRFLEKATESRNTDPRLMRFAYYWAGYACNNLGRYVKAAQLFSSARRYADDDTAIYFEVYRQEEESRFFDLTNRFFVAADDTKPRLHVEVLHIRNRLSALRERALQVDAQHAAQAIAITQGNICTWLARSQAPQESEDRSFFHQALEHFGAGGQTLWAQFGHLEARREVDSEGRPAAEEYARLEQMANSLTQRRTEPRSRTLLYLTVVLCMIEQVKPDHEIEAALPLLRSTFADVDGSLTVYSQHWKTNVTRSQFEEFDIEGLQQRRQSLRLTSSEGVQ